MGKCIKVEKSTLARYARYCSSKCRINMLLTNQEFIAVVTVTALIDSGKETSVFGEKHTNIQKS